MFGPSPGTAHLALRADGGGRYVLYVAKLDGEIALDILADLVKWLDAHEDAHRGYASAERALVERLAGG